MYGDGECGSHHLQFACHEFVTSSFRRFEYRLPIFLIKFFGHYITPFLVSHYRLLDICK